MAKYAIIENGKVINVAESNTKLANNWVKTSKAKKGDAYDGSKFTPSVKSVTTPPKIPLDELITKLVDKQILTQADADSIKG